MLGNNFRFLANNLTIGPIQFKTTTAYFATNPTTTKTRSFLIWTRRTGLIFELKYAKMVISRFMGKLNWSITYEDK